MTAALSADGGFVATAALFNDTVVVWDIATGEKKHEFRVPNNKGSRLAFSPVSQLLASGSTGIYSSTTKHDESIHLWDLKAGSELRTLNPRDGAISALAFAPDGYTLAAGTTGATAIIWDLTSIRLLD